MKWYKPNSVPVKTRVLLGAWALLLFLFAAIEVAVGSTFMVGKRTYIFLSGIPTLMLAAAAVALAIAAVLAIVDHYDKRQNEIVYRNVKSLLYKVALSLAGAAPFVEILDSSLRDAGYGFLPEFNGLASQYALHLPSLKRYAHYLEPYADSYALPICLVAFALCGVGGLVKKYFVRADKRIWYFLIATGMLLLSSVLLAVALKDMMVGEVVLKGGGHAQQVISAHQQPAKFNAVLLTRFFFGGFMFLVSSIGIVGVATNKLRLH